LLIVLHGVQGVTGNVLFQISDLVSLLCAPVVVAGTVTPPLRIADAAIPVVTWLVVAPIGLCPHCVF